MAANMDCTGSLNVLEGPIIRVPFESLKRAAKDRKTIIDEAQQVTKAAVQAMSSPSGALMPAEQLTNLMGALQSLKRRLEDVSQQEKQDAERCRARLQHLQELSGPKQSMTEWNAQRLDRLLVDYLHRTGCYDTADMLSTSAGIQELVDAHVFEEAQKIAAALQSHDCGPCLEWCAANRGRLRKAKSQLEFHLRVQQFMELVKSGNKLAAIEHARQHLAPWASQCMQELQRALAVLVFAHRPNAPHRYHELLQDKQWDNLVTLFLQELYKLHGLPSESPFLAHLQAGLSALKTPASYQPGSSIQDPLSQRSFQQLAADLPYAKHVRSQLLCSMTRKIMDQDNPPVVLPSGYVYSQQAIDQIRAANNGKMVCPQTGQTYSVDELRRAYIV